MARSSGFRREQRHVALAMAAALTLTIVVMGIVIASDRGPAAPFVDRLRFAVRADLFVALWLAAAIANVARLQFFSKRDIAGSSAGAGSDRIRAATAILQNTLEQAGLAVAAHLIVAASFERTDAPIAALVCLFAVGRLLFWAGYGHGARGRAFGFALTFYPTLLALLASAAVNLIAYPAG